ncbi:MAG: hypothetical protein ACK4IS_07140 [Erythrobacter sp.]
MMTVCSNAPNFPQAGYFKDDARNRIFAFVLPADADAATVRQHAERQLHTSGQVTAAYYWRDGATHPRASLTKAQSLLAATELVDEEVYDRYAFVMIRSPDGTISFADCEADPAEALCQQAW